MKKLIWLGMVVLSVSAVGQVDYTPEMVAGSTKNVVGITAYTARDGSVWRVGEDVTIGNASGNQTFIWITEGDGAISPIVQAAANWGGKTVEIKKIRVTGSNRLGRTLYVTCKGILGPLHIDIEKAIETGEVVTSGYTSDKALAELKKAKDKLDLGLITQEEFDRIKAELSKYIE